VDWIKKLGRLGNVYLKVRQFAYYHHPILISVFRLLHVRLAWSIRKKRFSNKSFPTFLSEVATQSINIYYLLWKAHIYLVGTQWHCTPLLISKSLVILAIRRRKSLKRWIHIKRFLSFFLCKDFTPRVSFISLSIGFFRDLIEEHWIETSTCIREDHSILFALVAKTHSQ
jgi:hypothetical protein